MIIAGLSTTDFSLSVFTDFLGMAVFKKSIDLTKAYEHEQEIISGIPSYLSHKSERVLKNMTAHTV